MDGTFVTDGWTGNKTTNDGGRGIPSDVYSDNGWVAPYDLGDKVAFPLLSDPWRDPNTGAMTMKTGTTPYSHEEYFSEVLVADPANPSDGFYNGDLTFDPDCKKGVAVYWNATRNQYLIGAAATAAAPGATDDYVKFEPGCKGAAVMKMNGQIRVNGKLTFAASGNADTINYSGRCAFLTTGDVTIDARLLTCRNGVVTDYNNTFPAQNCLGVMTKTSINLGVGAGASQLDLMGGFYAQEKITSSKQTTVMGTFVSKFFDMGKNVPAIFQTPDLAINLPLGMIGNYPLLVFSQQSWRELGLG